MITTTVVSIFLSIAGIVLILTINASDIGIERYAAKNASVDEYKPDESNVPAGKEPIRDIITNFTNKNIMLIISFFRKQIESFSYTDLIIEDSNTQVILKED